MGRLELEAARETFTRHEECLLRFRRRSFCVLHLHPPIPISAAEKDRREEELERQLLDWVEELGLPMMTWERLDMEKELASAD